MGSTFCQKYSKLTFGPLSLISLFYWDKAKKDRLRVNCKAFLRWVGDGAGQQGILKAHPQAPLIRACLDFFGYVFGFYVILLGHFWILGSS